MKLKHCVLQKLSLHFSFHENSQIFHFIYNPYISDPKQNDNRDPKAHLCPTSMYCNV